MFFLSLNRAYMLLLNVWGTLLNWYEVGISILTGEKNQKKKKKVKGKL